MSKFKVGDKVVVDPKSWCATHFREKPYYLIKAVECDIVTVTDDDGDSLDWGEERFDFYRGDSPKEAANDIAPSGLVQSYIPLIQQWGRDRGILDNSTPLGQSRKTVEEVRELVEEAAILHACDTINQGPYEKDEDYRKATLDNLADALGDIFVTLVMIAGCAKLDINACVAQAYEEIKNRKGKMNDKGVWVKEEEQV